MRWAWRAGGPATCAEDPHERNTAQQRSAGNYLYYTVSGLMYPGTQRLYRKPLTGGAPVAVLNGVTDVRRNAQLGGAHMLGTTATGLVRIAQPDDASPGTSTHPLAGLRQALALQPVIIGPDRSTSTRRLGRRRYELTDHLGNVRVVLGDRKLSDFHPQNTPIPTHFSAEVMAYADYDPFGSLLPGRYAPGDQAGYRFGFQGQEKDDEIHDDPGTSYAFEYRMHDPRIGRFLSIDPLVGKYPYWSPYAFSGNRVIDKVELEGLEPTTPPSSWVIHHDYGDWYCNGSTVMRVSDAGSVKRWWITKAATQNGTSWSYYNPDLKKWGGNWIPEGYLEAGAGGQPMASQDRAAAESRAQGKADAAGGAAFSDAIAKGMLGLTIIGTGGIAGSELLAGSAAFEGFGAAARISANRLFQATATERLGAGAVNAGTQFFMNDDIGDFDGFGLASSVAIGNPFFGSALGGMGKVTPNGGAQSNDFGKFMLQTTLGTGLGYLSGGLRQAWQDLGGVMPTNGTAAMETLTTWGLSLGGQKAPEVLQPVQKQGR